MGTALMVTSNTGAAYANNGECNLFGVNTDGTGPVEAQSQASCTEAATFSKLGVNIISGGSGTNNFQFRKNGANGSQLASRAGTGTAEDTTNSDTLAAGDLFNLAYTDTGTNSVCSWLKGNVAFSSGHGAFHGIHAPDGGKVFDVASATRYIGLTGNLETDGITTEADAAFRCRGYTTFAALQVRVSANARTNDSTFRNRINAANGAATITFAAAETGLKTATGLTDVIGDGQTIAASITLGTGVEDLSVNFVVATLKSTDTEQDIWGGATGGMARAASATAHYLPIGGCVSTLTGRTEAQARIKPGFAGTAKNLRCYLSANTYTGTGATEGTLKLMKNGTAVMTVAITASGGAGWYENTVDTTTFTDTDEFSLEFDEGSSGSITIQMAGLTLAPTVAGGITYPMLERGIRGLERGLVQGAFR